MFKQLVMLQSTHLQYVCYTQETLIQIYKYLGFSFKPRFSLLVLRLFVDVFHNSHPLNTTIISLGVFSLLTAKNIHLKPLLSLTLWSGTKVCLLLYFFYVFFVILRISTFYQILVDGQGLITFLSCVQFSCEGLYAPFRKASL